MTAAIFLVALLCAQGHLAHAHSYFSAYADSDQTPTTAVLTLFEHADVVHWTLNVTDAAPGVVAASIVDGDPTSFSTAPVVVLASDLEAGEDGSLSATGTFDVSAFDPAYAAMSVDELKGHIGMGHIFLQLSSNEGAIYGTLEEAASEENAGEVDAEESAPMDDEMDHSAHSGHAEHSEQTDRSEHSNHSDHSEHSEHGSQEGVVLVTEASGAKAEEDHSGHQH